MQMFMADRASLTGYLNIAGKNIIGTLYYLDLSTGIGIHGRPYTAWDSVTGPGGYTQATGYCTHNSILFPTWHRPYLALFEV
jgi:hypothetical protein